MRVLLISANPVTAPYPVYPLGLDYVADAIADRHVVEIVDINHFGDSDGLKKVVADFKPEIIGLSLRNIDNTDGSDPRGFITAYQELIEAVRGVSHAPVVLGGSGFTIFPRELMTALNADYGVIGEGERFALLLDSLEKGEEVARLPGIVVRGGATCVPDPWDRKFRRFFDADKAHLQYYLKKGGMLNLQTKRGCNFNCIYCTYPYIEGNRLRLIPASEVADTALRLQQAGAKYLFITDSAFNSDVPQSMRVAREFIRKGLSIPWGAFFAPTRLPEEYFRLMADAGLTHVEFGTEALSDPMLEAYRKPFRVQHVYETHRRAVDAGLYVAHYFLLGGPGEDEDTISTTLEHVDTLDKAALFFFCGIRIYPHTALYDLALKTGQISNAAGLLEPVFFQSEAISSERILERVRTHAGGRINWVIGAGGDDTAEVVSALYGRGHTGPLWEHLIR